MLSLLNANLEEQGILSNLQNNQKHVKKHVKQDLIYLEINGKGRTVGYE